MNVVARIGFLLSAVAGCAPAPPPRPAEPVAVVVTIPTQAPEPASPSATPQSEVTPAPPAGIPLARYRNAVEDYQSSVRPGNQTNLLHAAVPFATYISGMHNRLHPIFTDQFLASLDSLAPGHPINDPALTTVLELVLAGDSGAVEKTGVIRTSGQTAFDIAALDAVMRAAPFGKPPDVIRSSDGKVYVHWEFHRDPVKGCSAVGARPYLLNP